MVQVLEALGAIKAMSFVTWNVRSLVKNLDEVKRLLIVGKVDVLVVVESYLDVSVDDCSLNINGYIFYRADRTLDSGKSCGGGIVVYVRNGLSSAPILTHSKCTLDYESLWIRIKLERSHPFYLCAVYRPPDGDVPQFLDYLEQSFFDISEEKDCEWVLLFDMNLNTFRARNKKLKLYNDFKNRFSLMGTLISDLRENLF